MARQVPGQGVDDFTAASRRAYAKMPSGDKADLDLVAAVAANRLKARGVKKLGHQSVLDLLAAVGAYMVKEGLP